MNCWLNLYKPRGISSARLVSLVKKRIPPKTKIGHAGTLDLEAEGVLPLAVGEATKLVQFLMDARKEYIFTVKFGAKTDTADFSGQVIETTDHIPTKAECEDVCQKFIGDITQTPPNFSALKVGGVRAYDLARQGKDVKLNPRTVHIYQFKCLEVNQASATATYLAECSKGTYIRTLAEDVALSLQSLGFVVQLRRTKVGIFTAENAIMLSDLEQLDQEAAKQLLAKNNMKIEAVLDDILVLEADQEQAQKIRFGQKCCFNNDPGDITLLWVKYMGGILAIGSLKDNCFISSRVFNVN